MSPNHRFPALIPAGLVVILAITGECRSQSETPPGEPTLPPEKQPLRVDPSKDLFELALQSYREAAEAAQPQRQNDAYRAAARQFERFHLKFKEHPDTLKAIY